MNSMISIILAFLILVAFIILFIRVSIRIRRGGGSLPHFISSGTLDATLDQEKKAATAMIVERNAQKKMEEQSSFEPPEKEIDE
jgi:hypothetical protein